MKSYQDGLASFEDCLNWYPELVESAGREEVEGPAAKDDEADSPNILRVELVGTEPYRLGDARREREAEAQQNGLLQ